MSLSTCLLLACGAADGTATADGPAATMDAGGSLADGDGTGAARIDVGGGTVNHSMNRLAMQKTGRTADYSQLTIELVSNDALAVAPDAPALAAAALVTSNCGMQCQWTFSGVDVTGDTLGLAARLRDTRSGGAVWIGTNTNAVSAAAVAVAMKSGQPYSLGVAFAVSRDAVDAVVSPMVNLPGDEVLARGVVFGLVYSAPQVAGQSGTPVMGATVVPSDPSMTIVYPNNNFSGTGAATATQGAFLAIPKAGAGSATVGFTVTANPALRFDASERAVVVPGRMYFFRMYPTQ